MSQLASSKPSTGLYSKDLGVVPCLRCTLIICLLTHMQNICTAIKSVKVLNVRLCMHTLQEFNELNSVASNMLQLLFSSGADSPLRASPQQVQAWLGQPEAGPVASSTTSSSSTARSNSSSSSSVLHVSSYRSSSESRAQHVLGGSEQHVDRGLLTVIADTGPGLQVGTPVVLQNMLLALSSCRVLNTCLTLLYITPALDLMLKAK